MLEKQRNKNRGQLPSSQRIDWENRWLIENTLINQRLTWLGYTQTILFAAFVLSTRFEIGLNRLLAGVGLLTTVIVFFGIWAAIFAQKAIAKRNVNLRAGYPPFTTFAGAATAFLLPVVFFGAWFYLYFVYEVPDFKTEIHYIFKFDF